MGDNDLVELLWMALQCFGRLQSLFYSVNKVKLAIASQNFVTQTSERTDDYLRYVVSYNVQEAKQVSTYQAFRSRSYNIESLDNKDEDTCFAK